MITIQARLEIFKQNFPLEKIKTVQERVGTHYDILEINHTWMCKTGKTQQAAQDLAREVIVLKKLTDKVTTQIPQPVYYQENFMVYKKIAGSPLITHTFFKAGHKQRLQLLSDITLFLYQLHNAYTATQVESWQLSSVRPALDIPFLEEYANLTHAIEPLPAMIKELCTIYKNNNTDTEQKGLIHNNFMMKNIIIDPLTYQLRGIIDFTQTCYDATMLDFAPKGIDPIEFCQSIDFIYTNLHEPTDYSTQGHRLFLLYKSSEYIKAIQQDNKAIATLLIKQIAYFLHATHQAIERKINSEKVINLQNKDEQISIMS